MNLQTLLGERRRIYNEISEKQKAIRKEYEPKLAALNLQIDREAQKGVGKRIRLSNTGRFNPSPAGK